MVKIKGCKKTKLWDLTMSRRREEEVAHIFSWDLVMVRKKKVVSFLKKSFFLDLMVAKWREEEAQRFFSRIQQWLKEEKETTNYFLGFDNG